MMALHSRRWWSARGGWSWFHPQHGGWRVGRIWGGRSTAWFGFDAHGWVATPRSWPALVHCMRCSKMRSGINWRLIMELEVISYRELFVHIFFPRNMPLVLNYKINTNLSWIMSYVQIIVGTRTPLKRFRFFLSTQRKQSFKIKSTCFKEAKIVLWMRWRHRVAAKSQPEKARENTPK